MVNDKISNKTRNRNLDIEELRSVSILMRGKTMNVALLSGAYKNAGDYLIVHRCEALIKHIFPGCTITEYERRKSLDDKINELNKMDVLILGGVLRMFLICTLK